MALRVCVSRCVRAAGPRSRGAETHGNRCSVRTFESDLIRHRLQEGYTERGFFLGVAQLKALHDGILNARHRERSLKNRRAEVRGQAGRLISVGWIVDAFVTQSDDERRAGVPLRHAWRCGGRIL